MSNYNTSVSRIESFLYDNLNGKVSKNTFTGLPDTMKSSWTDMCLIDCGNAIYDLNSYGRGSVMVWLYAKPMSDGSKNTKLMFQLESKLSNVLAGLHSDKYAVNKRSVYNDYDTERKWYCTIVVLNIIVY